MDLYRTVRWGGVLLIGGLVLALIYQRIQIGRLSTQSAELASQVEAARQNSPDKNASTGSDTEAREQGAPDQTELLRLRNEVTQLRRDQAELQRLEKENALLRTQAQVLQKSLASAGSPALQPPVPDPPMTAWVGLQLQAERNPDAPDSRRVMVGGVMENSPAAEAKLQDGDLILSVNGESITNILQIRNLFRTAVAGQPLVMDLLRENAPLQLTIIPQAPSEEIRRTFNR